MTQQNFSQFALNDDILNALNKLNYLSPTPVQKEVIPQLLNQQDIIVTSQTGSGKTAAFGIPLCQTVTWEERAPQALILTPTRELALQIKEDLFNIGRYKRLKITTLIGKSSFQKQTQQIKQRTHIVVATPGRLFDHMMQDTIDLSQIKTVIIDEADDLLNMGFLEIVEDILNQLPTNKNIALFSATMPEEIKRLAEDILYDPKTIQCVSENTVKQRIEQYVLTTDFDHKVDTLKDVLVVENPDTCIIFANRKHLVDSLASELSKLHINANTLHGGMEQRDRTKVIQDFKRGYFRYLVATDIAARGLDIPQVDLVINFDLPESAETYTHRIGRTARFENNGKAISFATTRNDTELVHFLEDEDNELKTYHYPSASIINDRVDSFIKKQQRQPKLNEEKGFAFKSDIQKLHINAGKKTKMRAGDVVGAICQIEGVTANDIGVIDLLDISTFVEILNGKGETVFKALQKMPIKGRMRRVSRANVTTYERDLKQQNK